MSFRAYRLVLPLAASVILGGGCGGEKHVQRLGGSWDIVSYTSSIPEAGGNHPSLWRNSKAVHVLVEGDTYVVKYVSDDCVLYISLDSGHLGAACGDRQPLILAENADRIPNPSQFLDQDPLPISDHESLTVSEIFKRAKQQPALTRDWKMPTRPR